MLENTAHKPQRLLVIACEVFCREAWAIAADSPYIIDTVFVTKSLHDIGERLMSSRLQEIIDSKTLDVPVETRPDAIVLLYGLCNNGIRGLTAPVPLVVPRAHDCITLLLGSRTRYEQHFNSNPATFYRSPGWIERDSDPDANPASVTARMGITHDYTKLVEQYGEDNAEFLMDLIGDWLKHYRRLGFINTGVGNQDAYRAICEEQARERDWEFEEIAGDRQLLEGALHGRWPDDEFLVLLPGEAVGIANDQRLICAERISADATKNT